MSKYIVAVLILVFTIGVSMDAEAGGPHHYNIDSIYDSANGEWLDGSTPQLNAGQTYGVTVSGSGTTEDDTDPPSDWAFMGLFIDWTGGAQNQSDWSVEGTDHLVMHGSDEKNPGETNTTSYSFTGNVTVPTNAPSTDTLAFAAMAPGNDSSNPNGPGYYNASQYYGIEDNSSYGDREFVTVHVNAVPEPATVVSLSLGILSLAAGGFFRRK